jgi:hypothetical protein
MALDPQDPIPSSLALEGGTYGLVILQVRVLCRRHLRLS